MSIPTPHPPQSVKHSSGVSVVSRSNETMRIQDPESGEFAWLQGGYVYDESGRSVEPPAWFDDVFKTLTPQMRRVHEVKADAGRNQRPARASVSSETPEPTGNQGASDLDDLNKADLTELAENEGVDVNSGDTKAMIISKILAKREQEM